MATPTDQRATVKALVRQTFDRAAEHFDDDALFFWEMCGRRTVELSGIGPGDRVLDVCCGTGASALPAAALVGPHGHVLGLDLAEQPLRRARAKAAGLGLDRVRFARGDLDQLDQVDGTHQVVLCVLGIYYARDLSAALGQLWNRVAPGGVLAVTTWGPRALEPATTYYLDAVAQVRPELRQVEPSWARINRPDLLTTAFRAAGLPAPDITQETISHPITPGEVWTIVLGSGFRLLVDLLGPAAASTVREALLRRLARQRVDRLTADVLYARTRRPRAPPVST